MKELILVGGGHAHIQVLHALQFSEHQVTLISDVPLAPYSGMLPGHLAGNFTEEELLFDLKKICARFKYYFIQETVLKVDAEKQLVTLSGGKTIRFDICSLNVGILPRTIPPEAESPHVIYVKPISNFLEKWRSSLQDIGDEGKILVVGGGAAAFELAVACGTRFPSRVTLITGEQGLTLPRGANKQGRRALQNLGVELIEGQKVDKIEDGKLWQGSTMRSFAVTLIAITARPTELIGKSGLPKSSEGHVLVDDFLRVKGSSVMFAAGDCAHFLTRDLPKAGVYAVRQGPVLAQNILSALKDSRNLKRYVPQKTTLSLLITGQEEALFCWRGLAIRGRTPWILKRWIDRRFMRKFS